MRVSEREITSTHSDLETMIGHLALPEGVVGSDGSEKNGTKETNGGKEQ